MNFVKCIRAFFKGPEVDPVALFVRETLGAASDAYGAALHAVHPYSIRANHRHTIMMAAHALYKAPPLDGPYAAAAYDEAVAAYADPDDFTLYTEAYLDAHTAAMDSLSATFDTLAAAFAAFGPSDKFYGSAAGVYKVACETYMFAAVAYSQAANCALITALDGKMKAIKDSFEGGLLETRVAQAMAADAVTANAKAIAFKAKAAASAATANSLEQKAKAAKSKTEILLAKAKSAEEAFDEPITE